MHRPISVSSTRYFAISQISGAQYISCKVSESIYSLVEIFYIQSFTHDIFIKHLPDDVIKNLYNMTMIQTCVFKISVIYKKFINALLFSLSSIIKHFSLKYLRIIIKLTIILIMCLFDLVFCVDNIEII